MWRQNRKGSSAGTSCGQQNRACLRDQSITYRNPDVRPLYLLGRRPIFRDEYRQTDRGQNRIQDWRVVGCDQFSILGIFQFQQFVNDVADITDPKKAGSKLATISGE